MDPLIEVLLREKKISSLLDELCRAVDAKDLNGTWRVAKQIRDLTARPPVDPEQR